SLLGRGAAAGCVAVTGVWLVQHSLTPALAWEAVATTVGLTAIFHVFVELHDGGWGVGSPALAAILAGVGMFVLLLFSSLSAPFAPWPWLVGWVLLTLILCRQAEIPDLGILQVCASLGLGVALSSLHLMHRNDAGALAATTLLGLMVIAA